MTSSKARAPCAQTFGLSCPVLDNHISCRGHNEATATFRWRWWVGWLGVGDPSLTLPSHDHNHDGSSMATNTIRGFLTFCPNVEQRPRPGGNRWGEQRRKYSRAMPKWQNRLATDPHRFYDRSFLLGLFFSPSGCVHCHCLHKSVLFVCVRVRTH